MSAIVEIKLDRIKQQDPGNIFEIDDSQRFQKQVANGHLEKPIATVTVNFGIEENQFAKYFVVLDKLTRQIIGMQFMRDDSVIIDTTHSFVHFPQVTVQFKHATLDKSAKPQSVLSNDNLTSLPMTTETINAFVYHPFQKKMCVMSCEQCVGKSRLDNRLAGPPMQNQNAHVKRPEDAIENDLIPAHFCHVALKFFYSNGCFF